jgi:hypothetical protein
MPHNSEGRGAGGRSQPSGTVPAWQPERPLNTTVPRRSATLIAFPRPDGVWLGAFRPREFIRVSPRLRASVARMAAAERRRP